MIERHQDYILTVASLPPGGVRQVPLKLDTDAPFALRLVRSRNMFQSGLDQFQGINGWRFTTPSGAYQSNALRTDWIQPVFAGQVPYASRGSLIWEEMIYPPGATINVDLGNSSNSAITNAALTFRGSKLYRDGSLFVPTYPERMAVLPAVYQVIVHQVPANGQVLNNQLLIKNDADFVFRAGVCDAFTLTAGAAANAFQFTNVHVALRDQSYKAYSNAPIHVNDLFGQGLPTTLGGGTSNDDQVLFTPGLMTPEIYIPRRHPLYFDVFRDDPQGVPVDLYFRFIGMKVFQR